MKLARAYRAIRPANSFARRTGQATSEWRQTRTLACSPIPDVHAARRTGLNDPCRTLAAGPRFAGVRNLSHNISRQSLAGLRLRVLRERHVDDGPEDMGVESVPSRSSVQCSGYRRCCICLRGRALPRSWLKRHVQQMGSCRGLGHHGPGVRRRSPIPPAQHPPRPLTAPEEDVRKPLQQRGLRSPSG